MPGCDEWPGRRALLQGNHIKPTEQQVRFCNRFLDKRDRTVDQMIQAARSGKQNILKGCMASGTSKETEIKLINVARASLEELLEDYRGFLRTHRHPLWEKDSREALFVRKIGARPDVSYESYQTYLETRPLNIVANILIGAEGGLRERMTRARLEAHREHQM